MAKISAKKQEEKIPMSDKMLKSCKAKIAKFGFEFPEYEKFLISVKAMSDDLTVLLYRNDEMENYREQFIKENESTIGDTFQCEKFKQMTSSEDGLEYETGYFAPRSFWDFIRSKRLN